MLYADTFRRIMEEEEGLCDRMEKQLSCTK